jgi:hypothetical protein
MPDLIGYDAGKQRLLVGHGYVENVDPKAWLYDVSGKQVLLQWFSYRKLRRERPIIGDRPAFPTRRYSTNTAFSAIEGEPTYHPSVNGYCYIILWPQENRFCPA